LICGLAAVLLAASSAVSSALPPYRLVAAAPGYPGTTAGAQPTMDGLANRIALGAGLEVGTVTAEYVPSEPEGVAAIAEDSTSLALVPFAFFLAYEDSLALRPIVQAIGADGSSTENWSLVGPAGQVDGPTGLAGWEVVGIPAYVERFVRGPLLGEWGLPEDVRLTFSGRVLGALRRIAAGERVAALLDNEQVAALPALPNPEAYEILYTSPPVPYAYVAVVGDRLSEGEREAFTRALLALGDEESANGLLATLRLRGFAPVDDGLLARARAALAPSG
jgi:hypothetical protein